MNKTLLNKFYLLVLALLVIGSLDLKLQFNPTVNFLALFRYTLCFSFWYKGKESTLEFSD